MGLEKLQKRIGFCGAGQMAEALARGFISKGIVDASSMVATNPVAARKKAFQDFDVKTVGSVAEVGAAISHRYNFCCLWYSNAGAA